MQVDTRGLQRRVASVQLQPAHRVEPPRVHAHAIARPPPKQHRAPAGQARQRVTHSLVRPRRRRDWCGCWLAAGCLGMAPGCWAVQVAPPSWWAAGGRCADAGHMVGKWRRTAQSANVPVPGPCTLAQPLPHSHQVSEVQRPAFRRLRQAAREVREAALIRTAAENEQAARGRC